MRVQLMTADGNIEVKALELPSPADVIVWEERYFVHMGGIGRYREAVVAFVQPEEGKQTLSAVKP